MAVEPNKELSLFGGKKACSHGDIITKSHQGRVGSWTSISTICREHFTRVVSIALNRKLNTHTDMRPAATAQQLIHPTYRTSLNMFRILM